MLFFIKIILNLIRVNTKKSISTILALATFLIHSSLSHADGNRISLFESDAYLKVGGGGSVSQASGLSYEAAFGYRLFKKYPSLFLGLSWSRSPIGSTLNPSQPVAQGSVDTISTYTLSVLHQFSDENRGWVAGFRSGYGVRTFSTGVVFAPVVQYHYGLFDELTVGLEAEVLGFWVSGLAPRSVAILGQAVIQYWF